MTEAELQRLVGEECARLGLLHHHAGDSRRDEWSHRGFPDSVIVGAAILYRELKATGEACDANQARWGRRIMAGGGDWAVWRPRDWEDGTIKRELLAACPGGRPRDPCFT